MERLHKSPLSSSERHALNWLVVRLPESVTPDILTTIGVIGAVLTFIGYVLCWQSPLFLWLAILGILINWFGDSLDGSLARYRMIERPRYGFFLDQNIDVFSNLLVGLGLALSPYIRVEVAFMATVGYHMLTIYGLVRACIDRVFHVTLLYSGPTEIRALLIAMNLLLLAFGAPQWTVLGVTFAWCDVTVGLFGLGFIVAFSVLLYVDAKDLRRQDDAERQAKGSSAS